MISDNVRMLLAESGKKQMELAEWFGRSKQSMSNKFANDSWYGSDLVQVAEFCGYRLAFIRESDGQRIFINDK